MKKALIDIQDTFDITAGVALAIRKDVEVDEEQLGEALRHFAHVNAYSGDDAGCDWFYSEERKIIFISNPEWVVSKDEKLIQILKTADLMTGSDYSAKGNGFFKELPEAV